MIESVYNGDVILKNICPLKIKRYRLDGISILQSNCISKVLFINKRINEINLIVEYRFNEGYRMLSRLDE